MLQQILKDMYIDPEVLDALNEEQKKTLFLKMRQEQVRRWKEREEKLEREDAEHRRTKPKKANSKNVSWLLGRDGDVAVIVIGEVDELSSKFICSGLGEKKAPSLQNNTYHRTILKGKKTTEAVRTERENLPPKAQPGISLNLKQGKQEETSTLLPLPVSVSEQSPPPAAEKQAEPKPAAVAEEKPAPQTAVCSRPPMRTSPVNVRPACARPGFSNLRQAATVATTAAISAAAATTAATTAAAAPSLATPSPAPSAAAATTSTTSKTDSGTTSLVKGSANSREPPKPRDSHDVRDTAASEASRRAASSEAGSSGRPAACAGRGRVAQLMKTFSAESASAPAHTPPPRGVKPPLPSKPSHLRTATTPSVR